MEGGIEHSREAPRRFIAELKTNAAGDLWYYDQERRVVVLNEAGELERERQQREPGSAPADGYPAFGGMLETAEMPVPPGEIAPEAIAAAAPAAGPDTVPTAPPAGPDVVPPVGPPAAPAAPAAPRPPEPPPVPPPPEEPPPPRGAGVPGGPGRGFLVGDAPPPPHRGYRHDWREVDARRYVGIPRKSIREILANERDSQLFGEVLKAIDPINAPRIMERHYAGNPTEQDMDFMNYASHEYALRLKNAEEVNRTIPQYVQLLADRDKNFSNLIEYEGSRGQEIVKLVVLHTSMKKPEKVEDMLAALKQMQRDREGTRYKQYERRVDALCRRVGIDRREYSTVFDLNSREGRDATEVQLEQRIHERAGKFRRALDWLENYPHTRVVIPGSSRSAAMGAMYSADLTNIPATYNLSRSNALLRIDENLTSIARLLGPTIGDPSTRSLIAREAIANENIAAPLERGPKSHAQVQQMTRDRFSPASIQTRMRERMENMRRDGTWPADAPGQDRAFRSMMDNEKRQHEGQGFWAWLFTILLEQNYNRAASDVLGRPAHI